MNVEDKGHKEALLRFSGLEDVYAYTGNPAEMIAKGHKREELYYIYPDQDKWRGATMAEVMSRRYGWNDGVKELSKLPGIELPACGSEFRRKWSETDGDDISVERMQDGLPCLIQRYRAKGNKQRRIASLAVNVIASCATKAKEILWKCYTASRLADELEAQGTRLEITAVWRAANCIQGGQYESLSGEIPLKRADDPLNVSQLLAAFSPWFMRTAVLMSIDTFGRRTSGHGRCTELYDRDKYTYYIGFHDCLSEYEAKQFLAGCKEK